MTKISIIVPVYMVEKYICRCVDSILNQTFINFELILVDDGSPDDSGKICDEYAKRDERIRVIHQKNQGLSAARNIAIEWSLKNSESEWLTFIDSDDWIHKDYLQQLIDAAYCNTVDVSICSYASAYDEETQINLSSVKAQVYEVEEFWMKFRTNATVAWGKLYKRTCFEKIRYPLGKIYEDEYTTYKILFQQKKIAYISTPLYFYYVNPNSITHEKWSVKHLDSLDALQMQADYFKKHGLARAHKSSAKLYLDKLVYNLSHLRQEEQIYSEQIRIVNRRLRYGIWKYGMGCDYNPKDSSFLLYNLGLDFKLKVLKPLAKKRKNIKEVWENTGLQGIFLKIISVRKK